MKRYLFPFILLPLVISCDPGGFKEPDVPQGPFSFVPSLDTFSSGDMGIQTRSAAVDGLGTLYLKSYDTPFEDSVEPETKTTPVTTLHSSFGASGYIYPAIMDDLEGASTPSLFFNTRFDKGYNSYWSEENFRMPGASYKMRAYAWAPYPTDEQISEKYYYITTNPGDASLPVLHFNSYHCRGIDLLEGVTDLDGNLSNGIQDYPGDNGDSKMMVFRHALAGIRFVTKDLGHSGTLKDIRLCCYAEGNFSPFGDWTCLSGHAYFDQTLNVTIPATGSSASYNDVLMVIPQTFDETCTLEVSMTLGGKDYEFNVPISGVTARKGYITNFILTLSDDLPMISVDPLIEFNSDNTDEISFSGTQTATVKSVSIHESGLTTNSAWTIAGYRDIITAKEDGGNYGHGPNSVDPDIHQDYQTGLWSDTCPDWLVVSTTSGNGGTTGEDISFSLNMDFQSIQGYAYRYPQSYVDPMSRSRNRRLQDASEVGSPLAAIDLSKNNYLVNNTLFGGFQATANCYVVTAPGWYKFPLVYGNALVDGEPNEFSFDNTFTISDFPYQGSTESSHDYDTDFRDSWGNSFSTDVRSPYISEHAAYAGRTLNYAHVLNQFFRCPVNNVHLKLNEEKGYLYFHIPSEGIMEDNIILAVYDDEGNVAWSWHIWVTGEKEQEVQFSRGIETKGVMNRTLGDLGVVEYDTRVSLHKECDILFKNDKGATCVTRVSVNLAHNDVSTTTKGVFPYYQYGRKDPLFSDGVTSEDNDNFTQADWHQNPGLYYPNGGGAAEVSISSASLINWCSDGFFGMWGGCELYITNRNYYAETGTKTIYDPCPPGWMVPDPYIQMNLYNEPDYYNYEASTLFRDLVDDGAIEYIYDDNSYVRFNDHDRPIYLYVGDNTYGTRHARGTNNWTILPISGGERCWYMVNTDVAIWPEEDYKMASRNAHV